MGDADDNDDNFSVEQLAPRLFMCREKYYGLKLNAANLYVLQGTHLDLVIDAGLGLWDFRGFLLENKLLSKDKPFLAVATHVHFDHTGGLHQFADACAIHEEDQQPLESGDDVAECTFLRQKDCERNPPSKDWKASNYRVKPVKVTRVLKGERDSIDLGGGQIIEVIHTPGHTEGSIVIWDTLNKFLFTGDTVYDGPLLDFAPSSNAARYLDTMEILSAMATEVKIVFPGHGRQITGSEMKDIADKYIAAAGTCHLCMTNVAKKLLFVVIRGRNAKRAPCARCCYHSCCFCLLLGPPMKHIDE